MISFESHGHLHYAYFLERINRFVAKIKINDDQFLCHVPNTGRMQELLLTNQLIIVRYINVLKRNTKYDLIAVSTTKGWMAIDSNFPNKLVKWGMENDFFNDFTPYEEIKGEVNFAKSRFDLYLKNSDGHWLIENKCCTFVEDGIAKFPDAPTDRGRRHMEELSIANQNGYKTAVFFIVQCNYANYFRPNDQMDPLFGASLRSTCRSGTRIYAFNCHVSPTKIKLNRPIPILL